MFGCEQEVDSPQRYILCKPLWDSCCRASDQRLDSCELSPLTRLCLANPSPTNLNLIAVVFRVYHAMKFDYEREINEAIAIHRFSSIGLIVFETAKVIWQEFVSSIG